MSELLSREKEFIKLNEQLDKLATTTGTVDSTQPQPQPQPQQQQQPAVATAATGKSENKFLTYTKAKGGPTTTLKKRGAGDGDDVLLPNSKPTNGSNPVRTSRGGNKNAPHTTVTSSTVSSVIPGLTIEEPLAGAESARKETLSTCTTTTNASSCIAGSGGNSTQQQRKYGAKSPADVPSRTSNRQGSQRMPPSSTATFTVKYRNPKFVESPSLEVLVKDESATIRSKPPSLGADGSPTDVESVTSYSGSVTKRSQGSTRKHFSTDGLIKFLKSKIVILEEDHDRISLEMTQQKELLEKTLERQKKVELQRDQAYAKHNALTEQLTKIETQLEEANRRIKERVIEQSSQQKELDIVKREVKQLTQTNTNLEKRLYRANEELENAKNALTVMKNADRELRETMRVESEGKDKQIKSLKKQRADLLNAYKKQLFLIDNLKRQNVCMEQSKMIGFSEKEFTKVLEWNTKT